jgi:hypothetical protein
MWETGMEGKTRKCKVVNFNPKLHWSDLVSWAEDAKDTPFSL